MNFHEEENNIRKRGFRLETERETLSSSNSSNNHRRMGTTRNYSVAHNLLANLGKKTHAYNGNKDSLRGKTDERSRESSSSIPYYSSNSGMYHALDYRNIGIRLERDIDPIESNNISKESSRGDESMKSLQSSTPRRSEPILIPRKVEEEELDMMRRNSSKELERYFESKTTRMNERRRRSCSYEHNSTWDPITSQQSSFMNSTSTSSSSFNTFFLDHGVLTLEEEYE